MTRWNEGSPARYLPAELVLSQAEIGVIVADRDGNVQFANEHAARLLRLDRRGLGAGRPDAQRRRAHPGRRAGQGRRDSRARCSAG